MAIYCIVLSRDEVNPVADPTLPYPTLQRLSLSIIHDRRVIFGGFVQRVFFGDFIERDC